MRRLFLMLGLVALVAGVAHAGTLVTNDGSFQPPQNLCSTTTPVAVPTPLTINVITQVVAAVSTKAIYVCGWDYGVQSIVGGTGVFLSYGTGSNCGTGNTIIDSAPTLAGTGVTAGAYVSPWANPFLVTPVGTALCIEQTGASGTLVNTGTIKYAQF